MGQFFQIVIHFHPIHPQPNKTKTSFCALVGLLLTELNHYYNDSIDWSMILAAQSNINICDTAPFRMAPTFVTAHTFCVSRDTRISYGWCLLIQGLFLRGLKLCGESRTLQVRLVSKKKIRSNHAFFRDNKASIWKKNAIHCFVFYCFFELLLLNFLWKMSGFPQFSFWLPIALSLL